MSSSITYLSQEARVRYANYALSVVTSRALPDVRDGLKPVQRRILFTMKHDLGLGPDAKYRKSAKIVGDVMGNYHPHGDMAIYDAMVRMAQPWVMRSTLVDGQGNFGSPDDDAAAAYRYTEAKLRPIALELLDELGKRTVSWRPSYDGTRSEPTVLPARLPNLLINGAQGIAVGMATSIPPHNLGEVIEACVAQIDAGTNLLTVKQLLKHIKGPDFPTGATLHATRDDLAAVYETGSGSLKLRGDYKVEEKKGGALDLILTSVPYGVARKDVVEKVAEIIINKKLPALVDVRDESTDDVRIVIELKKGSDAQLVMAYLYKHTSMQTSVTINLTCLVPSAPTRVEAQGAVLQGQDEAPCVPERLGLAAMIRHFLDFRMETVQRRLTFDLEELRRRIHLLEGFAKVFDGVDEALKLIRKSSDKADARQKLMARFELSEIQTNAVLDMALYKLSTLEIQDIRHELDQRRAEAKRIEALLRNETKRWDLIKGELMEIKAKYGDKRRTRVVGNSDEPEYNAEDFIAEEDATVIVTAQGWIKRVREVKDLATTRTRDGDSVLVAVAGSTRSSIAFFSNFGACYVSRIFDVPATTGYGEPIQKFFKLDDGERIIACMSFDPRVLEVPPADEGGEPRPPYALAVTRGGLAFRFPLSSHREPSNKSGRKFARLNEGDEVLMVTAVGERDGVVAAASDGVAIGVAVHEIAVLSAAGKGAALLRLSEGERVVGAQAVVQKNESVQIETEKGKTLDTSWSAVADSRGSPGKSLVKRDRFARLVPPAPVAPSLNTN